MNYAQRLEIRQAVDMMISWLEPSYGLLRSLYPSSKPAGNVRKIMKRYERIGELGDNNLLSVCIDLINMTLPGGNYFKNIPDDRKWIHAERERIWECYRAIVAIPERDPVPPEPRIKEVGWT